MSDAAKVYFLPLPDGQSLESYGNDIPGITTRLLGMLDLDPASAASWGVKVQLGRPSWPAVIDHSWAEAARSSLGGKKAFAFDTLSITEEGLHEVSAHLKTAQAKGYSVQDGGYQDSNNQGLPYLVADDPDRGPSQVLNDDFRLSVGAVNAAGLINLTVPRPHPHLGFSGAVAVLGLGMADRQGTLRLHRDIRPQVDTPLCAGCGSCLGVCLFDAINIKAGRAIIDHQQCTGCGECMTVCHMAGITPEEAATIPFFQRKVAAAGAAFSQAMGWHDPGKSAHISYLVQLDRWHRTASRRRSGCPMQLGILAATDPVALDQAAWDLIGQACGGQLSTWSGYSQIPEVLLAEAQKQGLGSRRYQLVTIDGAIS